MKNIRDSPTSTDKRVRASHQNMLIHSGQEGSGMSQS